METIEKAADDHIENAMGQYIFTNKLTTMKKEDEIRSGYHKVMDETEMDDHDFDSKIIEARTDFHKAASLYRSYVGKSESYEDRLTRINRFRCGG